MRLLFTLVAALVFCSCAAAMAAQPPAPPPPPAETAEAAPAPEAAEMTVDQLLDKMESVRKTLQTFRADVVKLSLVELLDETEKFEGNIQFKSPRLLRLQLTQTQTSEETIYIVGKEFGWIYRPYLKQAERGKLTELKDKAEEGNPLYYGLARDMHGLREGYILKLLPREKVGKVETIPLELTPEGGTTYDQGRIIFWIDLKTWLPVQVREYKSNDEIVETHTFMNIKINTRIKDSTFEFEPPKGTDVILHDSAE